MEKDLPGDVATETEATQDTETEATQDTQIEATRDTGAEGSPSETPTERVDQTLMCAQCGEHFVFSADEQEFFQQRELHAPPKRCKSCRAERRNARRNRGGRGRMGEYRGPAFQEKRRLEKIYRSPAFQGKQSLDGIYRSPAFRDLDGENVEEIYRSPAFQSREENDELYRGPAFRPYLEDAELQEITAAESEIGEHDLEQGPPPGYREPASPNEIYRSPAFANTDPANYAPSYMRREMHDILCAECGAKSRVPFKPRKDRPVYCKDCYAKKKG
jgi:CxxC-x17-CxxC domain-containing protein